MNNRKSTNNRSSDAMNEENTLNEMARRRSDVSSQEDVNANRSSTRKIEEGDEDYDDEDQGKDFEDYNEKYKRENQED